MPTHNAAKWIFSEGRKLAMNIIQTGDGLSHVVKILLSLGFVMTTKNMILEDETTNRCSLCSNQHHYNGSVPILHYSIEEHLMCQKGKQNFFTMQIQHLMYIRKGKRPQETVICPISF